MDNTLFIKDNKEVYTITIQTPYSVVSSDTRLISFRADDPQDWL